MAIPNLELFKAGAVAIPALNGAQPAQPALPAAPADSVHEDRVEDLTGQWAAQLRDALDAANTPLPPLRDRVAGLFPAEGVALISGLPGAHKTNLLMDVCGCIAAGQPWLPQPYDAEVGGSPFPVKTEPTRVLWLNADMNDRDVNERIGAVCRTHNLTRGQFQALSMPNPMLRFDDSAQAEAIARIALDGGFGVVAIDNLSVTAGKATLVDESIIPVMRNLRLLSDRGKCLVGVVAHEVKAAAGRDAMTRTFGSVQIPGLIDVGLSVTRVEGTNIVKVESGKVRRSVLAHHWWARYTFALDEAGDLAWFRFLAATQEEAEAERSGDAGLPAKILTYLRECGPATCEETAAGLGEMANVVRRALQRLVDRKALVACPRNPTEPAKRGNPNVYDLRRTP